MGLRKFELKPKYYRGRTYISAPATNGAMVKPGQITEIYYLEGEGSDKSGRVNLYWSDGWSWGHLGRWLSSEMPVIAQDLLQRRAGEAEEVFQTFLDVERFFGD